LTDKRIYGQKGLAIPRALYTFSFAVKTVSLCGAVVTLLRRV